MNGWALAAALAAVATVAYAIGRLRPGPRLLSWAEDQIGPWTWDLRMWLAGLIVLVAIVGLWTLHPRRTAANRRSWRDAPASGLVPRFDPDWAAPPRADS